MPVTETSQLLHLQRAVGGPSRRHGPVSGERLWQENPPTLDEAGFMLTEDADLCEVALDFVQRKMVSTVESLCPRSQEGL